MKLFMRILKAFAVVAVLGAIGASAYFTRSTWQPWFRAEEHAASGEPADEPDVAPSQVIVNDQAQENLGLFSQPLKAQTYWKTILIPGSVVDQPGLSDRGVTAPVSGVVSQIEHVPGDVVRPGEGLFTIRVLSESLHQTQTDLFKATQDIGLAQAQRKRLVTTGGALPEARLIEVDNQIARLEVSANAYRQELRTRGFTSEQIDGVADGTFVREMTVSAPPRPPIASLSASSPDRPTDPPVFELQDLKVDLGQQVQAGQTLCTLADHRLLAVEGQAFRDETPLLERTVREKWPVEVDFQEVEAAGWGEVKQTFYVRHLSNTIDPVNRTFAFRMPLANESRVVEHDGRVQTLWRFRPGQKVRLHVRVEQLDNVFVLPAAAVTRDGPESFIFTQNVNTFTRHPVRVLVQDRQKAVIANDGSFPPGTYVAQAAAAQLNRMVKAGGASGVPKGYHVHADGSLHKNEDEGK